MGSDSPDPQDEFWHEPASDDPKWRESYYFDFYDPDSGLAYFSSIGYRINKGYMGSSVAFVWDDEVYVTKDYAYPTETRAIQADGLLYESVTPNEEWRVRHLGGINQFEPGSDALERTPDEFPFEDQPLHTLDMDVEFEGIHDPVYYEPTGHAEEVFSSLYTGHADQALVVEGEVTLGDQTVEVEGVGERDHSWGIRDWRDPEGWVWTSAIFDEDTAVNFWQVDTPGASAVEGFLHLDGESAELDTVSVETQYHDDGVTQDTFRIQVTDDDGREFSVSADAGTVVPINFDYGDEVTTIRRTPTEYSADGKDGYGWTEYATTLGASEYESLKQS